MYKITKETQISVNHSIVTYSAGEYKALPEEAIEKLTKIGVLESKMKAAKKPAAKTED